MFKLFIIIACSIGFLHTAHAGRVVKVKGKKVYIIFSDDEEGQFGNDDYFYLVSSSGKKKAIVHIKKTKGLKAIALLKKGKAKKGHTTRFKGVGKKTKKRMAKEDSDNEETYADMKPSRKRRKSGKMTGGWGILGGFGMASQEVDQGTQVSEQSGSSMSFRGVYDYPIMDKLRLRAMAGAEMFSVEGLGLEPNGVTEEIIGSEITYLALDFLFQYHFLNLGPASLYASGGLGIMHPLSVTTTSVQEDSVGSLAIGEIGGGADIKFSNFTIPLEASFYFFPPGDSTSTSVISVKTGIVWSF